MGLCDHKATKLKNIFEIEIDLVCLIQQFLDTSTIEPLSPKVKSPHAKICTANPADIEPDLIKPPPSNVCDFTTTFIRDEY